MANRSSKEEKVIDYFRNEQLSTVKVVLNLVKAEVKKRENDEAEATAPVLIKKKKPGRKVGSKNKSPQNNPPSAAEMASAKTTDAPQRD